MLVIKSSKPLWSIPSGVTFVPSFVCVGFDSPMPRETAFYSAHCRAGQHQKMKELGVHGIDERIEKRVYAQGVNVLVSFVKQMYNNLLCAAYVKMVYYVLQKGVKRYRQSVANQVASQIKEKQQTPIQHFAEGNTDPVGSSNNLPTIFVANVITFAD